MAELFALLITTLGGMLLVLLLAGQAKVIDKLRFCLLDVFGGASWRMTFAMLLTVGGVCLLAIVAFGLFAGAERVQIRRIEQRPLALRLRAGRRHSHFDASYLMKQVKPELEQRFGDRLRKFSPFRVRELRVRLEPKATASSLVARTVLLEEGRHLEDAELIRHIPIKRLQNQSDTENGGVILCPQVLGKLGVSKEAMLPTKIYLDLDSGFSGGTKTLAVSVRGVLKQNLPENVDVLFSEELEHALFYPPKPIVLSEMRVSGFPARWDDNEYSKIKARIEKLASEQIVANWVNPQPLDDPLYRELWVVSQEPQAFEEFWKLELGKFQTVVNESLPSGDFAQLVVQNLPTVEEPVSVPSTYTYLGLYFSDPLALPLAADYLETLGPFQNRSVDRGQADQVASVRKLSAAHLKVLDVFRVIVALFAFLNLWIIQVLRAQQKSAEAGMLKAVGMNHVDMFGIVCLEAVLVWAVGALAGIVTGELVGRILSFLIYSQNLAEFGFASDWEELSLVLCVTALITLLSAVFGSLRWFLVPPGELMSGQ